MLSNLKFLEIESLSSSWIVVITIGSEEAFERDRLSRLELFLESFYESENLFIIGPPECKISVPMRGLTD